jgi:predicted DNA-binding transcriptional regulator AlpA
MSSESQSPSLESILTEKEVLELFGIKKSALDSLRRNAQLPFCRVTNYNRVYFVTDILEWLKTRRTVLNQHT